MVDTPATTPDQPIQDYLSQQVQNPDLPTGANLVPVTQNVQDNELMNNNPNTTITPATTQTPEKVTGATVDPNSVTNNFNQAAGQYTASTGNNAAQGTAAQGTVSENATVKGQLNQLYAESEPGKVPTWAQGAVTFANEEAAARGLGASTIGTTAIAAAIQKSAINIAAQDAQTFFQMDMANLSNQQQTSMQNLMNRQQGLLSDQSAENASKQFNAANAQQTEQFMASLVSSIQSQNADRSQAAQQFNVSEADKVSQFYDTLEYNRQQFNAQMQYAIDQSNVQWRRTVNTQNTATVNAANQVNAQNKFNMSQTSLNNLWQLFRDEANWAFTSSENQKNRDTNMAIAANNQSFASSLQNSQQEAAQTSAMYSALGGLASSLFKV